jgi:hypothetical protein
MKITIPNPTEEGVELKLVVFRAMEDIPHPAGGRLIYCPESPENPRSSPFGPRKSCQAYIMSHYAQMEGWQPAGVVAMGYDEIQKGELFWATTHGPANVLVKTKETE